MPVRSRLSNVIVVRRLEQLEEHRSKARGKQAARGLRRSFQMTPRTTRHNDPALLPIRASDSHCIGSCVSAACQERGYAGSAILDRLIIFYVRTSYCVQEESLVMEVSRGTRINRCPSTSQRQSQPHREEPAPRCPCGFYGALGLLAFLGQMEGFPVLPCLSQRQTLIIHDDC